MFSAVCGDLLLFSIIFGKNKHFANVEYINLVKFLVYLCSLSKDN